MFAFLLQSRSSPFVILSAHCVNAVPQDRRLCSWESSATSTRVGTCPSPSIKSLACPLFSVPSHQADFYVAPFSQTGDSFVPIAPKPPHFCSTKTSNEGRERREEKRRKIKTKKDRKKEESHGPRESHMKKKEKKQMPPPPPPPPSGAPPSPLQPLSRTPICNPHQLSHAMERRGPSLVYGKTWP